MDYSKHTVRVDDHRDVEKVLQAISSLPGVIVVNIAPAADATAIFLSEANLRATLADAPDRLFVEAVTTEDHRQLVGEKVVRMIVETTRLRTILCERHVDEAPEMQAFLTELDRVLLLLENFTLQRGQTAAVGKLQEMRMQLAESSLTHHDNVRCMDDLHYEILPTLNEVLKSLGGRFTQAAE